ncbi:MAG: DUF447 family protein [Methylohalobius sp.]|nr:DUF447 family protein [Methylohalobius sp.]
MILETIVVTQDEAGQPHLAPMGVHSWEGEIAILPYRPSQTLNNLLATGVAVVNATDDVRVFAGCLTGRLDFPLVPAKRIACFRLRDALAHSELKLIEVADDPIRPKLRCRIVHQENHAPFLGFNRAQFAVLEAAILVSRLNLLPIEEIETKLPSLRTLVDKTGGPREMQAWDWLMAKIQEVKR